MKVVSMPNILIKVPYGAFPGDARAKLLRHVHQAAISAEQMPADPMKQMLSWVMLEEIEPGMWTCGGQDISQQVLTCFIAVLVPAGVLDADARASYVHLMHAAFQKAVPAHERRRLVTSVVLHDVAEGTWGGNGSIWTLPTLAKAAGYAHLQHLVADSTGR